MFILISKAFNRIILHLKLRLHGVRYGSSLRGNNCVIKNKGRIEIGNRVSLNSCPGGEMFRTGLLTHFTNAVIKIGNDRNLNGTFIHSRKKVVIGDYCLFGPDVIILDNDSHNTSIDSLVRRTGEVNEAPVIIGKNVWVGMRSIIMKGVHWGDNSILCIDFQINSFTPFIPLSPGAGLYTHLTPWPW